MNPSEQRAQEQRVSNLQIFRAFLDVLDSELSPPTCLKIVTMEPYHERDLGRVLLVTVNLPEEIAAWEMEMGGSESKYEGPVGVVSSKTEYRVQADGSRRFIRVVVHASRECGPCLSAKSLSGRMTVLEHQKHLEILNGEDS